MFKYKKSKYKNNKYKKCWNEQEKKSVGDLKVINTKPIELEFPKSKNITLEELRHILNVKIDWIKVFQEAYLNRPTSWNKLGYIREWRNATDEVSFAVWNQLRDIIKKDDFEFIKEDEKRDYLNR